MSAILSTYIPLLLLFTISFSSKSQKHDIQKPFLENEIVQFIFQPNTVELNDYFIYPSNDKFKNCILPFLSSEKLLKIYFHFRNLYPNKSIENFLPDSRFRFETTVIDLQKSYFAYIFKNEFSCFNPIIFENEQNYRTVTLGRKDNNTEEDSFYALSASNKIFPGETYILPQNRQVFVAFGDSFDNEGFEREYFFAAEKKAQGKFTAIAYGIIPKHREVEFSDYLDFILEAHHLNYFKKYFCFKIFDFYKKYRDYISNTRWSVFVKNFNRHVDFDTVCLCTSLPAKVLYTIFHLIFVYITYFPIYYVEILPFYILSFPFGYFNFQSNFVISGIITKNYVLFWTLPCFFSFIGYLSYFELYFIWDEPGNFIDMQIKPQEIKWAVPYLRAKKRLHLNTSFRVWHRVLTLLVDLLVIFGLGFLYTFPLSPFMMIQGEANE